MSGVRGARSASLSISLVCAWRSLPRSLARSLRAPNKGARFASEFRLAYSYLHCTGLCRFWSLPLVSMVRFCLGSFLLCSSLLCSGLCCVSASRSSLFPSLHRLCLPLVAFDFYSTILAGFSLLKVIGKVTHTYLVLH